jgi:hypothetical protein
MGESPTRPTALNDMPEVVTAALTLPSASNATADSVSVLMGFSTGVLDVV